MRPPLPCLEALLCNLCNECIQNANASQVRCNVRTDFACTHQYKGVGPRPVEWQLELLN